MPTLSLPFPSLLTSPLSSYFLPTTTTTTTTTTTSPPPLPPPLDTKPTTTTKPPTDNNTTTTTTTTLELRRVFEMFDHNGDGRITMGELTSSLQNMGILIPEPDLARMIARIDADGDGCLDGAEFEALYRLITEERDTTTGRSAAEGSEEDEEEHDLREAFGVFDKNGDGFITVDELRAVLGSFGAGSGRSLEECKVMIMKVDVDGDGRVSFLEFRKMMKEGCFGALS